MAADSRTVTQLEAEGYHHICGECCKGYVWLPFNLLRKTVRGLDSMTVDQIGAKMRCDRCGCRPTRYYPARQEDAPGYVRGFSYPKTDAT
ncbi:hypothetical protein [Rhodopseudomonas sp. BR0G17]|uniref:hypothetical protein n=1 Tax=Rhodopseudomonas sp. BR0G17 TaxID=2269368 RepID=UPI0013DE8A90|nr:hypothetical protein [Rhodopseudomonas sp. BR0G17]NEW96896.1 hypothetical protein [Rhodopseudomonas sp. BR0G17]